MKVVQLVKGAEPLGITVTFDPRNGAVKVHRVLHGGAADRSGKLFMKSYKEMTKILF